MNEELTIEIDGIKYKLVPDDCCRCNQCSLRKLCDGMKLYCNIGGKLKYGKYGHFEKVEKKVVETVLDFSFNATDSELIEATYFIPKGCYVEIDGDKITIKKRKV